jgi:hypothetical protein
LETIILCNFPIDTKIVDPDYENEYSSAKDNNFNVKLISYEDLITNNLIEATKKISQANEKTNAIYRGWMLTKVQYEALYNILSSKNYYLINSIDEYIFCHYLPYNYDTIKYYTAKSIWTNTKNYYDIDKIMDQLKVFNNKPIIIKDYVKSQKHKWKEACFIENSGDKNKVKTVIDNFINLQEDNLTEGLVFREFLDLEFLDFHSKSGMPLTKEYRLFFYKNELLSIFNYWENENYNDDKIDLNIFISIAKNIKSNFFTMDIAKAKNGKWYIIELGDGQVSGLPSQNDSIEFYKNLAGKSTTACLTGETL